MARTYVGTNTPKGDVRKSWPGARAVCIGDWWVINAGCEGGSELGNGATPQQAWASAWDTMNVSTSTTGVKK